MNLKQTWQIFWQNKNQLPVIVFSDLLFYYLFIQLGLYVINRLSAIAAVLMNMFGDIGEVVGTEAMQNAQVIAQYKEVTKLIWLFFGGTILIWIIFKGISWYQTHKIIGNKIKPKEFAIKFLISSVFWYVLGIVSIMIVGYLNYLIFLTQSANNTKLAFLMLGLILLVAYFGAISYCLPSKTKIIRTSFVLGVKKFKQILPSYLLSLIVYALSISLVYTLFIRNFYITLVAIIVIILPAIQYTRLLMVNTIKRG
jgi:hypothetical protein